MRYINHLSDFQVVINITDKDGNIISPPSVPWEAVFADESGIEFKCYYDGNNYTHCIVDGNDIVCFIDNPGFSCGKLRCTFYQHVPSEDYCDGVMDLSQPLQCDIILSKRESDDSTPITIDASPNWVRGEQGIQGIQGEKGADGFSPIVSLVKQGSISTLSITDAQGEHTTEIADGAKGDDGFSPIVSLNKVDKVTTLTITDANGEHTALIEDGVTPDSYTKAESDAMLATKQNVLTAGKGITIADDVISVEVVQSTGTSETSVMSQKAVSDALSTKADKTELDSYATKEYVQTNAPQETKESIEEKLGAWLEEDGGESYGEVYTKAEIDALLSGKVSKSDIVQSTGTSTTSVMSQKAVSDVLSNSEFALLYELGFSDLRHFYASRVDVDTSTYYVDAGIPEWVRTCPMINNRYALNIDRFFTDNNVGIESKKYTKQIDSKFVWIEIIDNNSFVAYKVYNDTKKPVIEDASTVGEFAFCEIAKGFKLDITGFSTLVFKIDKIVKSTVSSRYGLNGPRHGDLLVHRERGNKYYSLENNVNLIKGYAVIERVAASSYSNIINIKRGDGKLEIEQAKINSSTLEITSKVNGIYDSSVPLINPIVSDIQDEEKLYLSPLVDNYFYPLPYIPHTTIKVYGKK